ncbi:hypothetical protein EDD93_6390 [Streptomyces sp. 840.1]|uniref:hypothetical protein n=1 Tax=Streptomyces sp. 840.1 TaxID=2485152 RepID=UPI000F462B00|nr:hypothetical protein [Streptomyces sp. 840.1]ROQ63644.1 hypothetical protein EDD93_6390 [Streptomyces sp. 840.1]
MKGTRGTRGNGTARTGGPRGYPARPVRRHRVRPALAVFLVTVLVTYAASVIWPLVVGANTWMWVDAIVFPFIALIAYSTIFGDRTEDGSPGNSPFG